MVPRHYRSVNVPQPTSEQSRPSSPPPNTDKMNRATGGKRAGKALTQWPTCVVVSPHGQRRIGVQYRFIYGFAGSAERT